MGLPTTCVDDDFGPWAGPACRGGFDFTLLFEETILTIPIQALFLYLLPIRIIQLLKEETKVKFSWHRIAKAVSSKPLIWISLQDKIDLFLGDLRTLLDI